MCDIAHIKRVFSHRFSTVKIMRTSGDVIADVVNGHGPELAAILDVSKSRCYEILSTDNPYPKAKRLIRAIAQIKGADIRLIKADLDAMFHELLNDTDGVSDAELHRENSEAVQAVLDHKPVAEQKKELREAIAVNARKLRDLDKTRSLAPPAEVTEFAAKGGGR